MTALSRPGRVTVIPIGNRSPAWLERRMIALLCTGALSLSEAWAALGVEGLDLATVEAVLGRLTEKGLLVGRVDGDQVFRFRFRSRVGQGPVRPHPLEGPKEDRPPPRLRLLP